jgi:hypothetical protein
VNSLGISSAGAWVEGLNTAVANSEEAFHRGLHCPRRVYTSRINSLSKTFSDEHRVDGVHELFDEGRDGGTLLVAYDASVVGDVSISSPKPPIIPQIPASQDSEHIVLSLAPQ